MARSPNNDNCPLLQFRSVGLVCYCGITLLLAVATDSWGQEPVVVCDQVEVVRLIELLSDDHFATRSAATDRLRDIRKVVGKQFREMIADGLLSDDPEVRWRCQILLDEMPDLLEPLPANRENELRSSGRLTTSMQITFVNETDQLFHLYWLNSSGERVEYSDIEPHSERTRGSYEGHPWLLTDDEGTGLIIFVPGNRDAVALIDEASLRQVSN